MYHRLKIWPKEFAAIGADEKTFDFRKNDRDFRRFDILCMEEWDPDKKAYTGRHVLRTVGYIQPGGQFGIPEDYVIMGFFVPRK